MSTLSFGLSNIRALRSVAPIPIRPITLLVGRNSSGKSSFLRSLPLLRQSAATRTSAPVLWFGELVDFGDFRTTITDGQISDFVSFKFIIDDLLVNVRPQYGYDPQGAYDLGEPRQFRAGTVEINFDIGPEGNATRISSIDVTSNEGELKCSMTFAERTRRLTSLIINHRDYLSLFQPYLLELGNANLLSHIYATSTDQESKVTRRVPLERIAARASRTELASWMQPHVHGRTQERTRQRWASVLLRLPSLSLRDLSGLRQRSGNASFSALVSRMMSEPDSSIFDRFREIYNVSRSIAVLDATLDHLNQFLGNIQYMGPVRTRNERYYRYQDLAVSEIDPDARNFPMFLNSLAPSQIERFSRWVRQIFGFGVKVARREGHISVHVVQGNKDVNVVDTGYGVSQVLPILGQIWWAKYGRSRAVAQGAPAVTLTIEQPELHLHPAHQALIADALVASLKRNPGEVDIRFLIETHSEALINRLGEFINLGKIPRDYVSVNLFHPDSEREGKSTVTTSTFGEAGELIDWPVGFFQPDAAV